MANSTRTTEDDLTADQKTARDAQLAAARRMTDDEAAELGQRVEAAWPKYAGKE